MFSVRGLIAGAPRVLPFISTLFIIAVYATAVALASRFGHSLTVDEPFMANTVRLPWRELFGMFPVDNVPFAYVLFKVWTAAFGESEVALRTLPAIAYAGTIILTGLSARRIGGDATGLMAAALLAASDKVGLVHAATARPYAILALIASSALLQSVGLLRVGNINLARRWLPGLALWLTHLTGLFTHPTYVVLCIACAVAGLLASRSARSAVVVAPMLAVTAYGLLWQAIVRETIALQTTSWMQPPTVSDVKTAYMLLWGVGPGFILGGALLTLAVRSPALTVNCFTDGSRRWILTATAVAWMLPVVISFWKPIFESSRTPMLLLPLTCVLVAAVVHQLGGRWTIAALAIVFLTSSGHRIAAGSNGDPFPTHASVHTLLQQTECGDTVIATGLAHAPVEYYLRRLNAPTCLRYARFPSNIVNWPQRIERPDVRRELEQQALELAGSTAANAKRAWVVTLSRGLTHEASTIMESALRGQMSCREPIPLRGAFFDAVIRCDAAAAQEQER